MVGTHAGDMIGEIALAIEMGADAVDIGKTIHPHPTLGENTGMAAEVADGSCTDLPPSSGRPRFLAAVSAQTADFNEVRSPKNPAILGITSLNFLSVCLEMALPHE